MAKHGLRKQNASGERLCEFCDMNELAITTSLFPHKDIHRSTWVSPDGKTRNKIDHKLINKQFRNSVNDTRVCVGRDHCLECTTIRN